MTFEDTTNAQHMVNPFQYAEETQQGVSPSTATFVLLPPVVSVSVSKDDEDVDIMQVGPEDLLEILGGLKNFKTTWKMYITAAEYEYIKRAINAANPGTPTGTISAPLTIIYSIKLNGTTKYVLFKGSRFANISLPYQMGKEILVSIDMEHTEITLPLSAHGLTSPTLTTTYPTGPVYKSITDGATSPFSWKGTAINVQSFNLAINRNVKTNHVGGVLTPYNAKSHSRKITGDSSMLWTNDIIETDHNAKTAGTLIWTIATGKTITLTGVKWKTYKNDQVDASKDEDTVETGTFTALGAVAA